MPALLSEWSWEIQLPGRFAAPYSLSLASMLPPRVYCADQEPRKRDNSRPLPKICPGFMELPSHSSAKECEEDRSCREPWQGRTSATIPPRPDHSFHHQQYAAVKTQAASSSSIRSAAAIASLIFAVLRPVVVRRFKIDADTAGVRFHDFAKTASASANRFFVAKNSPRQAVLAVRRFYRGPRYASGRGRRRRRRWTARTFQIGSSRVAPGNWRIEMDRHLEFFVRLSRPGHGAQENGLFGLAAVGFAEPVMILGLVGPIGRCARNSSPPGVFSKLVIALAEQEVKRPILRDFPIASVSASTVGDSAPR